MQVGVVVQHQIPQEYHHAQQQEQQGGIPLALFPAEKIPESRLCIVCMGRELTRKLNKGT